MEPLISEKTVTQPYQEHRCWFGKRPLNNGNNKGLPDLTHFCGQPALLYEVTRSWIVLARMWLCPKHVQKMTELGFAIKRAPQEYPKEDR